MSNQIEQVIGFAATKIANEIDAHCIISIEQKKQEGYNIEDPAHLIVRVAFFKKIKKDVYSKIEYETKIRKPESGSIVPIKELFSECINKNYIKEGDRIVCVVDESVSTGYKGLIFTFDVDKVFFNISTKKLTENIASDIVETVISIAQEIGGEGREGKKIGTAFIIGDKELLKPYLKQLIINPFNGYPEEARKITDPTIKETIKSFSQLDGVFILSKEGIIQSAGTYIDVDTTPIAPLSGMGTKHRNCAAITFTVPESIAVVVSESGGKIRVFKEGKLVMLI